jgi:hypothetical protein
MTRSPRSALRRIAVPILAAGGTLLLLGGWADPARNAFPHPLPAPRIPENVLFAATFDSAGLAGWHADRPDVWSVTCGMLRAELPDGKQQHSLLRTVDSTWTDYAVDLDVCGMRGVDKGVVVRARNGRGLGVDLRGPGYHDVKLHLNELPLGRVSAQNANAVWHHLRVEVRDNRCRVIVNGEEVIGRRVPLWLPERGGIALPAYTGGAGECTVFYDNVVVTPLVSD